jgi:hypothetical protein
MPGYRSSSGVVGSAPIKLLGRKAQTVPMTDRTKERTMTEKAKAFSRVESSWPKSLR